MQYLLFESITFLCFYFIILLLCDLQKEKYQITYTFLLLRKFHYLNPKKLEKTKKYSMVKLS